MISEEFPLSISWYTTPAGNDYHGNRKRTWSSYCELSYPSSIKKVGPALETGPTPWDGMYSDKFNVVNIGLLATKKLKTTSTSSLPIFGKVIVNPCEEQVYLIIGLTL